MEALYKEILTRFHEGVRSVSGEQGCRGSPSAQLSHSASTADTRLGRPARCLISQPCMCTCEHTPTAIASRGLDPCNALLCTPVLSALSFYPCSLGRCQWEGFRSSPTKSSSGKHTFLGSQTVNYFLP